MENLTKLKGTVAFKDRIFTQDEIKQIRQSTGLLGISFTNCPVKDEDLLEICELKKLVNVTLENTNITDRSLQYLATLPDLKYLFITNANILGHGFQYFVKHRRLDCVWVCDTRLNNETLAIAAQIPKLSTLRIDGTLVTLEGLMAVAVNPRLGIVANGLFTPDQIELFEQEQRRLAKKKNTVDPQDMEQALARLSLFFEAMTVWEKYAVQVGFTHDLGVKCNEVFEQHCTYKPRRGYRPENLHYSDGPYYTYLEHRIVDTEQVTKNKIYIFTKDQIDFQYRFILMKKDGNWLIDEAQTLDGGWRKIGL